MSVKATWLIVAAVTAVVIAGVVDAFRGSSSKPEATQAGKSVIAPSTTTAIAQTPPEPAATTEPVATTEPIDATMTATEAGASEHLPRCGREQLRLTFTAWEEGLAAALLRRVNGEPCHHGRAPIGFTVRDQSGNRVVVFGGGMTATEPADFSNGFEQLLEFPQMSCDPEESFLVVATVGPYVVRRTLPGAELPCNHG
jgi:hypothetical protein